MKVELTITRRGARKPVIKQYEIAEKEKSKAKTQLSYYSSMNISTGIAKSKNSKTTTQLKCMLINTG